jgi:hypothetical protein
MGFCIQRTCDQWIACSIRRLACGCRQHLTCAASHLQSFAYISGMFRPTRGFAAHTACTPGAQVARRWDIAQCVATVYLVGLRCCGREPTDVGLHIVGMQSDRADLSDRSVVTAIWDAMRRETVGSICPVGEASLGFSTLGAAATAVVVIGLTGSAGVRMKKSMFTFRRK